MKNGGIRKIRDEKKKFKLIYIKTNIWVKLEIKRKNIKHSRYKNPAKMDFINP